MSIPGFTAEVPIYKVSKGYYMNNTHANLINGREIIPQDCRHFGHLYCCNFGYGWFCNSYVLPM